MQILNGIRLGDKRFDLTQFDHVFWCGDLNYRLEPPGESKEERHEFVVALSEAAAYDALWELDELQRR